jgi:hypothetical protein
MKTPTATAKVTARGPSGHSLSVEFTTTIEARVVALRNESGAVFIQHVFTDYGDVLSALRPEEVTALYDQAATAFDVDDLEADALEDARHVGRL